MDKTEKFFYLPQATNASFVPSPSDGPSCTPEPLEPEPGGADGAGGELPLSLLRVPHLSCPQRGGHCLHLPGVLLGERRVRPGRGRPQR